MVNPLNLALPAQIAVGATAVIVVAGAVIFSQSETEVSDVDVVAKAPQIAQEKSENAVAAVPEPPVDTEAETAAAPIELSPIAPTFDVVRVDGTGGALIAGKAEPGVEVSIVIDAKQIETVRADASGAFVALFQLPEGEAPKSVGLRSLDASNVAVASVQQVLIVPPSPEAKQTVSPTIVLANETGTEVLQSETRDASIEVASRPLSLDTISYDHGGAVVLAGQGTGAQFVRVYVDNAPVQTELVADDGQWQVVLPDVDQGTYTLRIDEIDEVGLVKSRVESPFRREAPEAVLAAGEGEVPKSTVVVQPGHTLWALAQDTYGDGVKYVQIFRANRDNIRDANLIYPGQVFDLPK